MFERPSSISIVKTLVRCLGVFMFVVSACTPVPTDGTPTPAPTCPAPSLNPYRSHLPPNEVTNIFTNYKNGSTSYESARQDAFVQLGENVRLWSDYKDVVIDEEHRVRVSITYLDPMVIQYVMLNYALTSPNHLMDQSWFTNQIQAAMESLAKREEILFIVTMTAPDYGTALPVSFPIDGLKLVNSSGMRIQRTHNDPVLSKQNDIAHEPIHGFVGYPVSLSLQGSCVGVVDMWTYSFSLDLSSTSPDDNPFYNHSWDISYQSIIPMQENNHPAPTLDPSYNQTRFGKLEMPPTPNWEASDGTEDMQSKYYWEEMGRYIWNEVLKESGH